MAKEWCAITELTAANNTPPTTAPANGHVMRTSPGDFVWGLGVPNLGVPSPRDVVQSLTRRRRRRQDARSALVCPTRGAGPLSGIPDLCYRLPRPGPGTIMSIRFMRVSIPARHEQAGGL